MKNNEVFVIKNIYENMPSLIPHTTKKERALAAKMQNVRTEPKIGRNEPCPCHSGKKYKNCCL